MTKIIQAKYRRSRRLGVRIWGTSKDAFNKRNYAPGVHGQNARRKVTTHGIQLRAKQIVRTMYDISEKQLSNLFKKATRMRGATGDNIISLLESRFMTVVYRSKLANSIYEARQLVGHGHFLINGKKVNIPSYTLKIGDEISLRDKSKKMNVFSKAYNNNERVIPDYINFRQDNMTAKLESTPLLTAVPNNSILQVNLVIEYYSS